MDDVLVNKFLAIASVERTGSTLLCSILRGTKVAGTPIEYLNIQTNNFARFRRNHGVPRLKPHLRGVGLLRTVLGRRFPWRDISWFEPSSWREYLRAIARVNTTPNGVFGVKMHWNQYERHMLSQGVDVDFWGAPVRWVRITRRDEIRQAISFVRAAQTDSWNSSMKAKHEPHYDSRAILEALERIDHENSCWSRYFAEHDIHPLHITFEELTRDTETTIRRVLHHIGESVDTVPPTQTSRQSDGINAEWARLFVREYPHLAHRHDVTCP
jgi:LPS sulfotransferase NodH